MQEKISEDIEKSLNKLNVEETQKQLEEIQKKIKEIALKEAGVIKIEATKDNLKKWGLVPEKPPEAKHKEKELRAYYEWVNAGKPKGEGTDKHFWSLAEKQLKREKEERYEELISKVTQVFKEPPVLPKVPRKLKKHVNVKQAQDMVFQLNSARKQFTLFVKKIENLEKELTRAQRAGQPTTDIEKELQTTKKDMKKEALKIKETTEKLKEQIKKVEKLLKK